MKHLFMLLLVLGIFGLNFSVNAFIENSMFSRMYNPQTVESFEGKVLQVSVISSWGYVNFKLLTDLQEEIRVYLVPTQFYESQPLRLKEGDRIQVKGSRVYLQGETAIIASELVKGGQVLKLRDANGKAVWGQVQG